MVMSTTYSLYRMCRGGHSILIMSMHYQNRPRVPSSACQPEAFSSIMTKFKWQKIFTCKCENVLPFENVEMFYHLKGQIQSNQFTDYHTHTVINYSLYIFCLVYFSPHCSLRFSVYHSAVTITDNSSFFGFKIHGLLSRGVSNLKQVIMARTCNLWIGLSESYRSLKQF